MKRNNSTTAAAENKPVKAVSDSIIYDGEIANNSDADIRSITASNLARTTTVRYKLVHLAESDPTKMVEDCEMETRYCNSVSSAERAVAEALRNQGVDLKLNRVMVYEYINTKAERRVYDVHDLFAYCNMCFDSEEDARKYGETLAENWSIRKVDGYNYSATAWVRDTNGINSVEKFGWHSSERYSGLRSYTNALNKHLEGRYELKLDSERKQVIYIEPESRVRTDAPDYVVITSGNLAKCKYRVIGTDDADNTTADIDTEIEE